MAFKVLIEILNAIIGILNRQKLKIYDYDNTEYYLKEIFYRNDEDKLYFKCEEDNKHEQKH